MRAYLTRALQLARQLLRPVMQAMRTGGKALAAHWHRCRLFVQTQAPVIRRIMGDYAQLASQHALRTYRNCLEQAARISRGIMANMMAFWNSGKHALFHYTPIVVQFIKINSGKAWQGVSAICIKYLRMSAAFVRKVISFLAVAYRNLSGFSQRYTPIVINIIKSKSAQAWHGVSVFLRLFLASSTVFLNRAAFFITTAWKNSSAFLRHYFPILVNKVIVTLQQAWRTTVNTSVSLIQHTATIIRRVIQDVVRAAVTTGRIIYSSTRAIILNSAGASRRAISGTRQMAGAGLNKSTQTLITASRLCLQQGGRIFRAAALIVSGFLAYAAKISLGFLVTVKKLLLWAFQAATNTFLHICGYLGRGSRRLYQSACRIVAVAGERLYQYGLLARLNKPIGIFLLLWPTLWALWIAGEGLPDLDIVIIFICGVVLMRSGGCIVNDLVDREIDAHVARTRQRPLATGKVNPQEALWVAGTLFLCAFLLVLQLNMLTIGLSVAGLLLAILYPFTKRYTYIPQFFLGMTFGWAVPMAFAAQTGTIPAVSWIVYMATVLWALVYDTMYAMVDRADDIKVGVKSTAILFDDADRFIVGIIQTLVMLSLLLTGSRQDFNWYYYAGLALAAVLFIYQQYLIKDRAPAQCFKAFLNNNWFGAAVFAAILMNYRSG